MFMFGHTACMFIAHNSASKELVKLRRAFNTLDIENDGVIRVSDFTKAMKEAGWEQSKIDEAFKNLVSWIIHWLKKSRF